MPSDRPCTAQMPARGLIRCAANTQGIHGCILAEHDAGQDHRCMCGAVFGLAPQHAEQPMPVPNHRPSIQGMVRADLEQREQVGIQRYGTPLQAHNGRDALRDAYEEALDLACYLRQAIEEREEVPGD